MTLGAEEDILTVDEAARYLKTSRKTVLRMIWDGKIRANKVGRSWRILRSGLHRYLRGQPPEGSPADES